MAREIKKIDDYQREVDAELKKLQDEVDLHLGKLTRKSRHNEVDVMKAKGVALGVDMAARKFLSVPIDKEKK